MTFNFLHASVDFGPAVNPPEQIKSVLHHSYHTFNLTTHAHTMRCKYSKLKNHEN